MNWRANTGRMWKLSCPFPIRELRRAGLRGRKRHYLRDGDDPQSLRGQNFIQPTQPMRDFGVRVKLNPVKPLLENKKVLIVEDSIIRGTTSRNRVQSLRKTGIKEICYGGKLPAHGLSVRLRH